MKSYKIDLSMYEGKVRCLVSEAVQKKAFELEYSWRFHDKEVANTKEMLLFLKPDGSITFGSSKDGSWAGVMATEISAADFLSLTDASDEPETVFKPFDRVMVRIKDEQAWCADVFSHMSKDQPGVYLTVGGAFPKCVPYEGNESLLGTTNSPE